MWWATQLEKAAQVIQDRWCGLPLNDSASADGDPAADG